MLTDGTVILTYHAKCMNVIEVLTHA